MSQLLNKAQKYNRFTSPLAAGSPLSTPYYYSPRNSPTVNANADGTVSVSANASPIRDVLSTLLKVSGTSGVIDPNLDGSVTAELNHVAFETALHAVISGSSQPISLTVEDGVYHFEPAAEPSDSDPLPNTTVSVSLQSATLPSAIDELCKSVGVSYVLQPWAGDMYAPAAISLDLHNVLFGAALDAILKAAPVPLTFKYSNHLLEIMPAQSESAASHWGAFGGGGLSYSVPETVTTSPQASETSPMVQTPAQPESDFK